VQFFCDGQGADLHELWLAAARLDLLACVSLIPARLGRSELLLSADLLIQPQALGMVRPVTLAAMARGVPVLARRDRWLDYLEHERTAVVLEDPDTAAWTAWLGRFIADPDSFQPLAQRARDWVARRHSIPGQVGQTIQLYRRLVGEAIPFPRAK
jgi:glycosyltransferase involved in cell wall biosynthesis